MVKTILRLDRAKTYLSHPQFSQLLNTHFTSICTHYSHPFFKLLRNGQDQIIITCIDVNLDRYLKIKQNTNDVVEETNSMP